MQLIKTIRLAGVETTHIPSTQQIASIWSLCPYRKGSAFDLRNRLTNHQDECQRTWDWENKELQVQRHCRLLHQRVATTC